MGGKRRMRGEKKQGENGYMCEVCGKQYKLEHWYRKHLTDKHSHPHEPPGDGERGYLTRCPNCGFDNPESNVTCWSCGYCLDIHLRVLAGIEET